MTIISHPQSFKTGTRVLFVKGRYKDGLKVQRYFSRISHGEKSFDRNLFELLELRRANERIYASASPRSLAKASRIFRERQLNADYDDDRTIFYKNLDRRWTSCLMSRQAEGEKHFLFDCDSDEDIQCVTHQLHEHYSCILSPYIYETKNGHHVITSPFNPGPLSLYAKGLMKRDPLILWAY